MLKSLLPSVTKRHVERKLLQTHPRHLFNIIKDVDAYQDFLPLCTHSKILRTSKCGTSFDAVLKVGLPPVFTEEYTSRVTTFQDNDEFKVHSKSMESTLFDSLTSTWILRDGGGEEDLCDVDFSVEMTVSDPMVASVLDQVLQEVAGRQVDAFENQCRQVPFQESILQDLKQ